MCDQAKKIKETLKKLSYNLSVLSDRGDIVVFDNEEVEILKKTLESNQIEFRVSETFSPLAFLVMLR